MDRMLEHFELNFQLTLHVVGTTARLAFKHPSCERSRWWFETRISRHGEIFLNIEGVPS